VTNMGKVIKKSFIKSLWKYIQRLLS
jgi:hypothetical protein